MSNTGWDAEAVMDSAWGPLRSPENQIKDRLASIRQSIEDENVSYGEIAELQSLAEHIDGDVLLLQWAGVPEFEDE